MSDFVILYLTVSPSSVVCFSWICLTFVSFMFQLDLSQFMQKSECECLNESDDHPLDHALTSKGGYLESDCDEQVSLWEQAHSQVILSLTLCLT